MRILSRRLCATALALLLSLPAAVVAQQSGAISGTVTGPDGEVVRAAQVVVTPGGQGALSNDVGRFLLNSVPTGSYTLAVSHLGYETATVEGVTVRAGETAMVNVVLRTAAVELGGVVVSASRQAERVTDAPATVTRVGEPEIALSVGNSFSGALKQVQGLDFIQVGATTVAVNARGFNSSFNNRMLMLADNRISVLPESGLPVGTFTTLPKVDLAGLEVIVGPGAALYGADASNGVISIQTKDPLEYPGTTVELATGLLDKDGDQSGAYNNVQFRHAGVAGKLGYKITGEWQNVDDWSNTLTYASGGVDFPEIGADFTTEVRRASGALVWYEGLSKVQLSAGWSQNDGVGQTNVGRNQFVDWTYNFVQLQATTPHWYFNAYRNQSQSGESFALNRYSVNRALPAFDGMSDRDVQLESDWPSDGRLYAAELQNNFTVSELIGGDGNPLADTEVVWGGQIRRDIVSSDREWLTDRFDDEDVEIGTWGVYGQTRTPLHEKLDLILAARFDQHDNYDGQFSPKAGLVFMPAPGHAIRATYNRAFKSPTILQTNFWIPDFVPFVGVFGNTEGFTVRGPEGEVFYEPLVPESNTTYELGYKGVLGEKLFLDVTGYYADYENFFSPLSTIANPFSGTVASFGTGTDPILSDAGNPQVLLTYVNLGAASVLGTDIGARYAVSETVDARATLSLIELDSRETGSEELGGAEATSLNSPGTKWTLGATARELSNFTAGATMRYVNGYEFNSGINKGEIPTFTTLDLTAAYAIEQLNTELTLNVTNLFTCRSADPALDESDGTCGIGVRHREMINMPMVGTMVFVGVRIHR